MVVTPGAGDVSNALTIAAPSCEAREWCPGEPAGLLVLELLVIKRWHFEEETDVQLSLVCSLLGLC